MHPDIQLYKPNRVPGIIGTVLYASVLVPMVFVAITGTIDPAYYVVVLGVLATFALVYGSVANTNRKLRLMRHNAAEVTRVYGAVGYGVGEAWKMTKELSLAGDVRGENALVKTRDHGSLYVRLERVSGEWNLVKNGTGESIAAAK